MDKRFLLGAIPVIAVMLLATVGTAFADSCVTIPDGTLTYSTGHYLEGEPLTLGYDPYGYNYQAHIFNGLYCNVYLGRDNYPPYDTENEEQYLLDNPNVVNAWYWPYRDVKLVMKWNDAWLSNKDCDDDGKLDRPESVIGSGAWETNHQWGTYWNLVGEWTLEFYYSGRTYPHEMTIDVQEDGEFLGTGKYPTGGPPYTYTWNVTGTVDGNGDDVEMTIKYNETNYEVTAIGTIADDGTLSGTWSSIGQTGTWKSATGNAKECNWNYFVKIVAVPEDAYLVDSVWYTADGVEIGSEIWGSFAIILQISNDPCANEHGVLNNWAAPTGFGYYK